MFKKWNSTNRPMYRVASSYWNTSTFYEKITDIGGSVLLSGVVCLLLWLKHPPIQEFIPFTNQLVSTVITVLSILAGFNIAAVSIIGSSQSPLIKVLAETKMENQKISNLEGIISFFSWAIVVQLIILLFSIIFFIVAGSVMTPTRSAFSFYNIPKFPVLLFLMFVGTSTSLHSILLTLRNITGLFLLLVKSTK